MRYLMNTMYSPDSASYNRPIAVPMVTPTTKFEFTFKDNGTTEGKESIKDFKKQLPYAIKPTSLILKEIMEEDGVKAPPWVKLNLKFDVEATNLYHDSQGKTAALLYETSDPRRFKLKIDYRWMKPEQERSNIAHEILHAGHKISGREVSEYWTDKTVVDAFNRVGDTETARETEKGSMYL